MFQNVDWNAVSALGTVATAIITIVLAGTAYWQISSARQEARISRTLIACDRYNLDPALSQITRTLMIAREKGDLDRDPSAYRFELYTVLNYIESLAIGIERDLYDDLLVRTYLEPIFVGYVELYIKSGLVHRASKPDCEPIENPGNYFEEMVDRVEKWSHIPWYRRQANVSQT